MPAGDRLVSLSSTGTLPAPVEERVTALAQLLVDALPDAITEAQVAAIAAQAVSGVVAGAPGALDTLDELAAALGDDPNLATTLTAQIATRYTKPAGGIPSSDLTAAVRTSLAKADLSQSATEVQALVAQAVSAVVAAAPGTLDTLDELAAAIGDDPNFAATFTALLAAKYAKPAGGIPATDLATGVQTSLGKADAAATASALTAETARATAAESGLATSLATQLAGIRAAQIVRGLVRLPAFTEFSFPMRIVQYEPNRRLLRVVNRGPATVQVAAKNATNSDFNAPSTAQWAAGDLIAPGQELVVVGNQLTHFMRTAATAQTAAVSIYTELVN